jgi:hypothetical protein
LRIATAIASLLDLKSKIVGGCFPPPFVWACSWCSSTSSAQHRQGFRDVILARL